MKKMIVVLIACFIGATAFCQSRISLDSVSAHVGDSVIVCSKVYGIKSLETITFINLGADFPKSPLTAIIRAGDMSHFPQPVETMYHNKNVCVSGTIKEYKGRYQIEVYNPVQIATE